ncbi:hypothetical protein GWI33_002257 [Rhynchophorus ferrugineus]|uniref:Uncharacterized protein n=1 Tax=Rhynchophorus ferrugineus TaxID=354439 RepID=A0A834HMT1_RHYFE|nr:hypothetical protein GWI33_002257 [Rhynchophorus ferrugineus]
MGKALNPTKKKSLTSEYEGFIRHTTPLVSLPFPVPLPRTYRNDGSLPRTRGTDKDRTESGRSSSVSDRQMILAVHVTEGAPFP